MHRDECVPVHSQKIPLLGNTIIMPSQLWTGNRAYEGHPVHIQFCSSNQQRYVEEDTRGMWPNLW